MAAIALHCCRPNRKHGFRVASGCFFIFSIRRQWLLPIFSRGSSGSGVTIGVLEELPLAGISVGRGHQEKQPAMTCRWQFFPKAAAEPMQLP